MMQQIIQVRRRLSNSRSCRSSSGGTFESRPNPSSIASLEQRSSGGYTEIQEDCQIPGRNTRIETTAVILVALRWWGIGSEHQVCLTHFHTLPAVDKSRGRRRFCEVNRKIIQPRPPRIISRRQGADYFQSLSRHKNPNKRCTRTDGEKERTPSHY